LAWGLRRAGVTVSRDVAAAVTLLVVAALIEAVIYPASLLLYRLI